MLLLDRNAVLITSAQVSSSLTIYSSHILRVSCIPYETGVWPHARYAIPNLPYLSVAVLWHRSEGRARHLQQVLEGSFALQQHQQADVG